MKSSFAAVALAIGAAHAQLGQLGSIPKCAQSCVTSYIGGGKIAGCKPADIPCVCKNQEFIEGISCCLQKDCDKAGVDATIKFAAQICSGNGVTTPDQLVCKQSGSSSAAAGSSTAASGSSAATGSAASGSSATASAASGSSAAASDSSAAASGTGSTATSGSTAASSAASGAAAASSSSAAAPVQANAGLFGAAIALVAAAL